MLEFKVTPDASGQRLDKFLRKRLATVPVSHLYKMVRTKKVRVNGARADIGQQLGEGDVVTVRGTEEALASRPEPAPGGPARSRPVGQDFSILHEDEHILI